MGTRRPNIKSLARRQDVARLEEAARYTAVSPGASGRATDSGISVRAEAILALGALGQDCGVEAVEAALRDPADSVRCAAVRVLHDRQDGIALAQALGWLPAEEGQSHKLAILAIVDLRNSVGASVVAEALVHREDDELLTEQDSRLFMELFEQDDVETRDEAILLLIQALSEKRGIVVDRAADLLVWVAPASVDALVIELRSGSAAADAAYVLGRIVDPQTIAALVEGLQHENSRVRRECTAALGEFEAREAVKPLLDATRDTDHGVRVQAAAALDGMGTSAVIVGVATLLEPMIYDAIQAEQLRRDLGWPAGAPPDAATLQAAEQPAR